MFRDDETHITSQQAVTQAVYEITGPWQIAHLTPPNLDILEVARTAKIPVKAALLIILENQADMAFQVEDRQGQKVNGNLREAAILSAPIKKVVRATQGKSAVAFEDTAYRMGLGRLRLSFQTH